MRDELGAFLVGLILARSDWSRQWNPLVYSCDSSLTGWGITAALCEKGEMAAVGRVLERGRFRRNAGHSARETALAERGVEHDEAVDCWTAFF